MEGWLISFGLAAVLIGSAVGLAFLMAAFYDSEPLKKDDKGY